MSDGYMKERGYIEESVSGDTTTYEIKYDNGDGEGATMAECWDHYLAKELAQKVAEYILIKDVSDEVSHFKEDGDLKEGWYRV